MMTSHVLRDDIALSNQHETEKKRIRTMKLDQVRPGYDYFFKFYGIEVSPKAAEKSFQLTVKWFGDLKYPPNKIAIKGSGHSGKVISFNRGRSRLLKTGFDQVSAMEISTLAEDGVYTSFDHIIEVAFGYSKLSISASTQLTSLSLEAIYSTIHSLIVDFKPEYGVGYVLYRGAKGGLHYLPKPEEDPEEWTRLQKWDHYGIKESHHKQGEIRDVYPFNFLNSSQLQMPVEGVSLSDWIQQDPQRGTLEPVDERLTLWKVPEESIPAIRDILWKTGQIFDWNKYCPPPLSPEEAEEFIRRSQACIEAEIAAELGTAPKPGMGYQVLYDAEGREVKVYGPPPQG